MSKESIATGVVHDVPTDIKKALSGDVQALEKWNSLTPLARNEWICWVTFVKKEETRMEHVTRLVSQLKEKKGSADRAVGLVASIERIRQ